MNTQNETAVIGWDNPLQTFFAQVMRPATGDEDDDEMLLWVGCTPGEISTVAGLVPHLASYADLSPEIAEQLHADRVAKLGQPPTRLQQRVHEIIRKLDD